MQVTIMTKAVQSELLLTLQGDSRPGSSKRCSTFKRRSSKLAYSDCNRDPQIDARTTVQLCGKEAQTLGETLGREAGRS